MICFLYCYYLEGINYSAYQYFLNNQFFIYFVVSEVFFFFGILWSLFWYIFSYENSFIMFNMFLNPFGLALFNTFLLLASSSFCIIFHVTYINYYLTYSNLLLTIALGAFFLANQMLEFYLCPYTISWFSFCSIFYFATGFHGFHVALGLALLILTAVAMSCLNVLYFEGLGNCVFLYWHFVDVIWLFLFTFAYIFVYYLNSSDSH